MHRGWAAESSMIMRCFLPVLKINSECAPVWDVGLEVISSNSLKLKISSRTLHSSATDIRKLVGNQPPELLILAYPYHIQWKVVVLQSMRQGDSAVRACRSMQVGWLNCPDSWVVKGWGSFLIANMQHLQKFCHARWNTLCGNFSLAIGSPRDHFSWNYTYLRAGVICFWNPQALFFSTHQPSSGSSVGGKLETLLEVGDCF